MYMKIGGVFCLPHLHCAHRLARPLRGPVMPAVPGHLKQNQAGPGYLPRLSSSLRQAWPLSLAPPLQGWGRGENTFPEEVPEAGESGGASGVKSHRGAICGALTQGGRRDQMGGSQLKGEPVIAAGENLWVVPSLAFLEQRL